MKLIIALSALALCWIAVPVPANAEYRFQTFKVNCTGRVIGLRPGVFSVEVVHIEIIAPERDLQKLSDDQWAHGLLTHVKREAQQYCAKESAAGNLDGKVPADYYVTVSPSIFSGYLLRGDFNASAQRWYIVNVAKEQSLRKKAEAEHQRREAAARQAAAEAAARARAEVREFIRRHSIERSISLSALSANPFPFKGKVVGLRVAFDRMRSADEAIFATREHILLVRGVPSTRFTTAGAEFFLAVEVEGLQNVKTYRGGETPAPYAKLVAVHECRLRSCAELAD